MSTRNENVNNNNNNEDNIIVIPEEHASPSTFFNRRRQVMSRAIPLMKKGLKWIMWIIMDYLVDYLVDYMADYLLAMGDEEDIDVVLANNPPMSQE